MKTAKSFLLVWLAVPLLSACSGLGPAVLDVAKAAYGLSPPNLQAQPLNPSLVYLEVATPKATALLVLAYRDVVGNAVGNTVGQIAGSAVEQQAGHDAGVIETWVSGNGEILRTQHGLVVGQIGVPDFWPHANVKWQGNTPIDWWVSELLPKERFVEYNAPAHQIVSQTHNALGGPVFSSVGSVQVPLPQMALPDAPSPLINVRKVKHRLLPVSMAPSALPQTPLLKRASVDPSLQWRAWWSVPEGEKHKTQHERLQVVAFSPKSGQAVYGQHCIAKRQCIEFLRRTAQDNR